MLILSRKEGERVLVGANRDIVITIIESSEGRVRLGISAPREVPVHREEVWQRLDELKCAEQS